MDFWGEHMPHNQDTNQPNALNSDIDFFDYITSLENKISASNAITDDILSQLKELKDEIDTELSDLKKSNITDRVIQTLEYISNYIEDLKDSDKNKLLNLLGLLRKILSNNNTEPVIATPIYQNLNIDPTLPIAEAQYSMPITQESTETVQLKDLTIEYFTKLNTDLQKKIILDKDDKNQPLPLITTLITDEKSKHILISLLNQCDLDEKITFIKNIQSTYVDLGKILHQELTNNLSLQLLKIIDSVYKELSNTQEKTNEVSANQKLIENIILNALFMTSELKNTDGLKSRRIIFSFNKIDKLNISKALELAFDYMTLDHILFKDANNGDLTYNHNMFWAIKYLRTKNPEKHKNILLRSQDNKLNLMENLVIQSTIYKYRPNLQMVYETIRSWDEDSRKNFVLDDSDKHYDAIKKNNPNMYPNKIKEFTSEPNNTNGVMFYNHLLHWQADIAKLSRQIEQESSATSKNSAKLSQLSQLILERHQAENFLKVVDELNKSIYDVSFAWDQAIESAKNTLPKHWHQYIDNINASRPRESGAKFNIKQKFSEWKINLSRQYIQQCHKNNHQINKDIFTEKDIFAENDSIWKNLETIYNELHSVQNKDSINQLDPIKIDLEPLFDYISIQDNTLDQWIKLFPESHQEKIKKDYQDFLKNKQGNTYELHMQLDNIQTNTELNNNSKPTVPSAPPVKYSVATKTGNNLKKKLIELVNNKKQDTHQNEYDNKSLHALIANKVDPNTHPTILYTLLKLIEEMNLSVSDKNLLFITINETTIPNDLGPWLHAALADRTAREQLLEAITQAPKDSVFHKLWDIKYQIPPTSTNKPHYPLAHAFKHDAKLFPIILSEIQTHYHDDIAIQEMILKDFQESGSAHSKEFKKEINANADTRRDYLLLELATYAHQQEPNSDPKTLYHKLNTLRNIAMEEKYKKNPTALNLIHKEWLNYITEEERKYKTEETPSYNQVLNNIFSNIKHMMVPQNPLQLIQAKNIQQYQQILASLKKVAYKSESILIKQSFINEMPVVLKKRDDIGRDNYGSSVNHIINKPTPEELKKNNYSVLTKARLYSDNRDNNTIGTIHAIYDLTDVQFKNELLKACYERNISFIAPKILGKTCCVPFIDKSKLYELEYQKICLNIRHVNGTKINSQFLKDLEDLGLTKDNTELSFKDFQKKSFEIKKALNKNHSWATFFGISSTLPIRRALNRLVDEVICLQNTTP